MTTNTDCNHTYPSVFVRLTTSLDWIESMVWPNEIVPESTTNKIEKTTETSTAKEIEKTTAEPTTTHKVEITTASSTINKSKTTVEPIKTRKVEITTESRKAEITTELSTSRTATTKLPPKEVLKSLDLNYIIIIVAVILLILCATVACLCFQVNESKKRENISLSVQCHL